MHPDHGFLHYDRFVKLDDSDSELEDLKEFLGLEMPIYDTPRHGYNALEILQITLGETPSSSLCTMKLCGVRTFASFIVDLDRFLYGICMQMIMGPGLPLHRVENM